MQNVQFPAAAVMRCVAAAEPDIRCSKDVKTAFSRAAGLFVLHLTSAAADIAAGAIGRGKTVHAEHVMAAVEQMGFEKMIPLLEEYLAASRRGARKQSKPMPAEAKRGVKRKSAPAPEQAGTSSSGSRVGASAGGDNVDSNAGAPVEDAASGAGDVAAAAAAVVASSKKQKPSSE